MCENVIISILSTSGLPTYNETFLRYWEQYTERFPSVIAVTCRYGDLRIEEDSWIYQWIREEYQPSTYEDGRYWRFYRLSEVGR